MTSAGISQSDEMERLCPGSEHIDRPMVDALLALSAKYQAIADAEETI